MEIGFASGCSSAVIAKALEMNGEGKLYTVDLKENPGMSANPDNDQEKVWRIDYFNEYVDKGIIIPTYPKDAIDYLNEFDTNIPIDLVFTDGGHEYNTVKNDLFHRHRLLKSRGTILCDDLNLSQALGVRQAIKEFSNENKIKYEIVHERFAKFDFN